MPVLIVVMLTVFFVRDYLLLSMGPLVTTFVRLREYALIVLASVILFSSATFSIGTERLIKRILSPPVAGVAILIYGILLTVCIWIKRTDGHHFAWRTAIVPNPILVCGLVLFGRLFVPLASPLALFLSSLLLACIWISVIGVSVWRSRNIPLDVPDLDFSISFASLVNSLALMTLPLGVWIEGSGG